MPSLFYQHEDIQKTMETPNGVLGGRIFTDDIKMTEGFTNAFPNAALDEINKRDDIFANVTNDVSRKLSDLARSQMVVNMETQNYLQSATRNTKYLNQIVQLNDGTIGYVTNQGVFKQFNSRADVDATLGKNGCPTGITSIKNDSTSTYSNDGKYVNADVPLYVGTPMVRSQQCGYAGKNIFVGKKQEGSGNENYVGCKKSNDSLVPTGFKMNVEAPACPVGTFQCQGNKRGYCYDPRRDHMVSTYMVPAYDSPSGSSSGNAPFLADDGVTQLWFRQGGFDGVCGTKPTMPPCPVGTAPCASGNQPGYCWDPSRKMMVTTVSPNGPSEANDEKPNFMYLVKGDAFNFSESSNPDVTVSKKNDISWNRMQGWSPDGQFTDINRVPSNKIYLQFKAAAAKMMPHLNIGETGKLTVITAGNVIQWNTQGRFNTAIAGTAFVNGISVFGKNIQLSNVRDTQGNLVPSLNIVFRTDTLYVNSPRPDGRTQYVYYFSESPDRIISRSDGRGYSSEGSIFTITKTSNNTAKGTLTYGNNSLSTTYIFTNSFPKMQPGFRSQDGRTQLWKKLDGYDDKCGTEPTVPPIIQGDEFLQKCKDIANTGGFGMYGIMDGECYIGETADNLQPGTGCSSLGKGMVGNSNNIAAYRLEGNKNTGMFKYGYVTADETLKEYPAELQRVTGRFTGIGRKQIARTPRNKTFTGISDDAKCKAQCISTFGDNCEAYNYDNHSGSCVAYGADSIKKGIIIPVGESELMIRQKELNNDKSCPKKFDTVNSTVWENLPKDSMMTPQRQCNLGYRTQTSIVQQQGAAAALNDSINAMQREMERDVASAKQLQPKRGDGMDILQNTLQEYKKLYEGFTNMRH